MPAYIVMTASAHMPSSCKGRYRRVALCRVADPQNPPRMISNRARGMLEIIQTWERCNATTHGGNTAFDRAMREAAERATQLNTEQTL